MRTRSLALFFLLILVFAGCDPSTEPDAGYLEIREVAVGPTLAKCYGVALQSCMVVDGWLFYDGMELKGASKNDSLSGKTGVRGSVASWRQ